MTSTTSFDGYGRSAPAVCDDVIGAYLRYSPLVLGITVPVIPGIMPIQAYASFLRVTKLCGTHIPDRIHEDLEAIKVFPSKFPLIRPPALISPSTTTRKLRTTALG